MPLPETPALVRVPDYFSPSSLGSSDPCVLKVLSSSGENRDVFDQLPLNPSAVFGTLVHRGLEMGASGELADPLGWLEEQLDAPSKEEEPYRCLRDAIPERKIQGVRVLFGRHSTSPGRVRQIKDGVARSNTAGRAYGPEVWLSSSSLRLRGKADFIGETDDGVIEIVDFKTGDVHGPNGEIKEAYVLQLQAYALMLRERIEGTTLRLVLDNGERFVIPSDDRSLSEAQEQVEEFTERFPKLAQVEPGLVANPGRECSSCRVRPSCAAYLSTAPTWWVDVPSQVEAEPLDTWGEITRIIEDDGGLTVHLTDQAGRGVKIDCLGSTHGPIRFAAGSQIWLFNLCADNRRRGFKGERPHPRLFHELPGVDGRGARAWDIAVFA